MRFATAQYSIRGNTPTDFIVLLIAETRPQLRDANLNWLGRPSRASQDLRPALTRWRFFGRAIRWMPRSATTGFARPVLVGR